MSQHRRRPTAIIQLLTLAVVVPLAACEPSPEDRFVAWCKKYETSTSRCACIAKKVAQDLSRDEFAQLMAAARADTQPTGSAGDFLAVVGKAVGSGKAAISLTAAAMTCS
jgi:hypothetical protein